MVPPKANESLDLSMLILAFPAEWIAGYLLRTIHGYSVLGADLEGSSTKLYEILGRSKI